MPICPEDGAELVQFTADANAAYATFWECPSHGGRYLSHGLAGMLPVPKAVVSNPPQGFIPVLNLYRDPTTGTLNYTYTGGGSSQPISGGWRFDIC